jgi:uncharacterized membrane protein YbhN (UPF0104 family)
LGDDPLLFPVNDGIIPELMSGKAGRNTGLWRVIRWALALLLAAAAAWLSIRQVQWATLEAVLARVRVPLLALALSTVLVTTAAKAVRWQVLLRPCEPQASRGRIPSCQDWAT